MVTGSWATWVSRLSTQWLDGVWLARGLALDRPCMWGHRDESEGRPSPEPPVRGWQAEARASCRLGQERGLRHTCSKAAGGSSGCPSAHTASWSPPGTKQRAVGGAGLGSDQCPHVLALCHLSEPRSLVRSTLPGGEGWRERAAQSPEEPHTENVLEEGGVHRERPGF